MTPERKKILIITYYWPPSGGAGVQRWLKFTKYLPEFGWEPIVLTVDETIASYPVIDETLNKDIHPSLRVYKTKSFEILSVFGRLFGKKNIPHAGFANHNKESIFSWVLRFLRGNFLIPDARRGWNKFAFKKASELIQKENIKHIITTSPPHSTQLIGLALKKKHPNVRWIADLRDPWTDIYYQQELLQTRMAKKIAFYYERNVLQKADHILVTIPSLKTLLASKKFHLSLSKITVITNGYDEADFKQMNGRRIDQKMLVFSYVGTIAEIYEPELLFKALSYVSKDYPTLGFKIQFIGSNNRLFIENLAKKHHLIDKIHFINYVTHGKAIEYMYNSDVLILLIPNNIGGNFTIPGKLFEYMATKNPIIALGPKSGDVDKIIRQQHCGQLFDRLEEMELSNYLHELIQKHLSNQSLKLMANDLHLHSKRNQTKSLISILESHEKH